MENLFLKRVNSCIRARKKEQRLFSQKTTGLLYDEQSFAMKQLRLISVLSNESLIHSNSTRFKKRSSIPLTDNTL
jgi:hypothetical protein